MSKFTKEQHNELEQALTVLEESSMRRTKPRTTILKTLITHHGPFSVDELLSLKETSHLDRVTIYRCLSAFEEVGLVQRCEFGDGVSRYEYSRGKHHHHHVICKRCGNVENIEKCIPKTLTDAVRMMGYEDVSHNLEFFGVCKKCAA